MSCRNSIECVFITLINYTSRTNNSNRIKWFTWWMCHVERWRLCHLRTYNYVNTNTKNTQYRKDIRNSMKAFIPNSEKKRKKLVNKWKKSIGKCCSVHRCRQLFIIFNDSVVKDLHQKWHSFPGICLSLCSYISYQVVCSAAETCTNVRWIAR